MPKQERAIGSHFAREGRALTAPEQNPDSRERILDARWHQGDSQPGPAQAISGSRDSLFATGLLPASKSRIIAAIIPVQKLKINRLFRISILPPEISRRRNPPFHTRGRKAILMRQTNHPENAAPQPCVTNPRAAREKLPVRAAEKGGF